jgi:hypothetical protein
MSESGPARSHRVFSQDEQFPRAARTLLPAVSAASALDQANHAVLRSIHGHGWSVCPFRTEGSGASAGSGFDRSGSGRGSSQITETAWANPTEDRVPVAEGKGCLREEPSGLRGARSDA